jgi:hypothetical protein
MKLLFLKTFYTFLILNIVNYQTSSCPCCWDWLKNKLNQNTSNNSLSNTSNNIFLSNDFQNSNVENTNINVESTNNNEYTDILKDNRIGENERNIINKIIEKKNAKQYSKIEYMMVHLIQESL